VVGTLRVFGVTSASEGVLAYEYLSVPEAEETQRRVNREMVKSAYIRNTRLVGGDLIKETEETGKLLL
jgi:hypothetical protein